jgi:cobyrinic acid a,c-diamide synthase
MTISVVKSLVIAGLSGGSGKSVVAVGLSAALSRAGHEVVAFKKGPDYIDAGWMTTAVGRPCYNLDPFLMDKEAIVSSFNRHAPAGGIAIVEGNRGLYDGVNAEGGYSTAELALQLDLPIILVVNCTKTTRTVAAMVLGCKELDKRVRIAGVVLNHIATTRQEAVIRQAVEQYAGVPVVGIVPRMKKDIFPMRHLGVVPHQEYEDANAAVHNLSEIIQENFDMEAVMSLMKDCFLPQLEHGSQTIEQQEIVTIGVIRDVAFQFYYEENLEALRQAGARLIMIDALVSPCLPEGLDALYIGGGFPETSASRLADNVGFRKSVKHAAEAGLPIYAECGGLIYLGHSLIKDGHEYPLTDVFPVTFGISGKPQAHGYSIVKADRPNPFYKEGTILKGHEFRYSKILKWDGNAAEGLALSVERGTGFMEKRDGLIKNNVLALYTHVLAPGVPQWAEGLVAAARKFADRKHRN